MNALPHMTHCSQNNVILPYIIHIYYGYYNIYNILKKGILILYMGIYILFMSHVAKTMCYNHW